MGSLDFRPISLVRRVFFWRNQCCADQSFRKFVLTRYVTEGDFTLVVSAFSPTHLGEFSLLVCSSHRVEVDPIPQEGAGMFAKTMRGEWYVLHLTFWPSCSIFSDIIDPVFLIMQDRWFSSAIFPQVAHTHRCQVSPHSPHSQPFPSYHVLTVLRSLSTLANPIRVSHHLQNPLAAPCTCIRTCRTVSGNRWDGRCLVRGFHRRTVRGCDCTSRTTRRAVYYRARGRWTSC
jgi:hypothetical protein